MRTLEELNLNDRKDSSYVQDDDCHWYCIPSEEKETFRLWVEQTSNYWNGNYDCPYEDFITTPDFSAYMCNGPENL